MEREKKLQELGYTLPEVSKPLANYIPGLVTGDYLYVSGQLPMADGALAYRGKLGADCSQDEGILAARLCAVNCLAVLKSLAGDLDNIERIIKITGFVNSTPDFTGQPQIINGASDLLGEVFGEAGAHTRSAVGAAALPFNACCEVEMIAKIKS